jgi:hypothetical protein
MVWVLNRGGGSAYRSIADGFRWGMWVAYRLKADSSGNWSKLLLSMHVDIELIQCVAALMTSFPV